MKKCLMAMFLGILAAASIAGCQSRTGHEAAGDPLPPSSGQAPQQDGSNGASSGQTDEASETESAAEDTAKALYLCYEDPSTAALYRVQPDGSDWEEIPFAGSQPMIESQSGNIYYSSYNAEDEARCGIFCMPPQGGESTQIVQGAVGRFTIVGDSLYFERDAEDGHTLWRASIQGGEAQPLPAGVLKPYSDWYIDAQTLYYTDSSDSTGGDGTLYQLINKMDLKTGDKTLIADLSGNKHLILKGIWGNQLVFTDLYAGVASLAGCYALDTGEYRALDAILSPKMMIDGDMLYFAGSADAVGLMGWQAGADAPQRLLEGHMGHFTVLDGAVYYCADDSLTGWNRYDIPSGSTMPIDPQAAGKPVLYSQSGRMAANVAGT